ncbi:hypothetical protein L218DRAFT_665533 [Marasmius fiardii PR-910]|nr:hypothetical protein L218DRAFT_665533 [Marasmius fiardii PR-910]
MNGTDLNKVHWTTRIIKKWLSDECSAMNYHKWDATRLMDMTGKIDHAVQMVTSIGTNLPPARDRSKSATASGLVGPLAGLTPTPTHSARQSPTGGLPAPNLLDSSSHSSSHSSSVPALQLLSSSTSSHSNSLRPVGPSVNLESGSTGWRPSITNNALALTLADDHDMSSLVRKKKRKDGRKSFSASTSQRTSPWHSFQEIPVPQQVDTSLDLRALGQALPAPTNQSDLPLFIPDFPGDLSSSSWKRPTKERRHSDKHPERRKEKQRRDQERDFFRRFKWEGRGSLLDDPREFVNRGEDHSESDAEEETSNSDEEEESNNRPLEYVPMPAPPVEVYTQEWEEQRHRQEKEWRERHDREPSVLSSDNRASFVGGGNSHDSEPATNSHFRRPQLSQTWPVLSVRNPELMMSIYSPRDSPAIPATQATSPPSLNPDPSAQTHHPVHAHRHGSCCTDKRTLGGFAFIMSL